MVKRAGSGRRAMDVDGQHRASAWQHCSPWLFCAYHNGADIAGRNKQFFMVRYNHMVVHNMKRKCC